MFCFSLHLNLLTQTVPTFLFKKYVKHIPSLFLIKMSILNPRIRFYFILLGINKTLDFIYTGGELIMFICGK
jgi:hypothetical protein